MQKNRGLTITIQGDPGAGKTWLAEKIVGILLKEGRAVFNYDGLDRNELPELEATHDIRCDKIFTSQVAE